MPQSNRIDWALTPTHLLVHSSGAQYFLEAFLLPDDDVPGSPPTSAHQRSVLTRSHIVSHPFNIICMYLLHTTHAKSVISQDEHSHHDLSIASSSHDTISMSFFVSAVDQCSGYVGILDVVLESPVGGEMTVSCSRGPGIPSTGYFCSGIALRGCGRFLASYNGGLLGFTVDGGEGEKAIVTTNLQTGDVGRSIGWDGLRGRLCAHISPTCIKIYDYV
jgi:hypothetical protein